MKGIESTMILHDLGSCNYGRCTARCRTCNRYTGTARSNRYIREHNCEHCYKEDKPETHVQVAWKQCRDCHIYGLITFSNRAEIFRPAICKNCISKHTYNYMSPIKFSMDTPREGFVLMEERPIKRCFGCNRIYPFPDFDPEKIPYCTHRGTDTYKVRSQYCEDLEAYIYRMAGGWHNNLIIAGLYKQIYNIKQELHKQKEERKCKNHKKTVQ